MGKDEIRLRKRMFVSAIILMTAATAVIAGGVITLLCNYFFEMFKVEMTAAGIGLIFSVSTLGSLVYILKVVTDSSTEETDDD